MTADALNGSERPPLARLARAILPPTCIEYTPETRPRTQSGTMDWMIVWLIVINPAWLTPMAIVAAIDNSRLVERASNIGPIPLVNPNNKNSFPRFFRCDPRQEYRGEKGSYTHAAQQVRNPHRPAPSLSWEMAGSMDS